MTDSREKRTIRAAEATDAKLIADIYNHYVTRSAVTFEEEPVTSEEIARRMEQVRSASLPWLVAEEDCQIIGYAHAAPWKTRTAYRFSVEITVYLIPERVGQGGDRRCTVISSRSFRLTAFTQ
jgi:L-amino acid N-acyltransferase YncA